jgi:hypothetical protein
MITTFYPRFYRSLVHEYYKVKEEKKIRRNIVSFDILS